MTLRRKLEEKNLGLSPASKVNEVMEQNPSKKTELNTENRICRGNFFRKVCFGLLSAGIVLSFASCSSLDDYSENLVIGNALVFGIIATILFILVTAKEYNHDFGCFAFLASGLFGFFLAFIVGFFLGALPLFITIVVEVVIIAVMVVHLRART